MATEDTTPDVTPDPTPDPTPPPTPDPAPTPGDKVEEEIPAWGKELMDKVNTLIDAVPDVVEEITDTTPENPPWHKRPFLKMGE